MSQSKENDGVSELSPTPRRIHTYGLSKGNPSLIERLYLSAKMGVEPGQRVSVYSYPMAQRDNPAPGNEAIPMTVEQRAAFLGWYADFQNPHRISLEEFIERAGIRSSPN